MDNDWKYTKVAFDFESIIGLRTKEHGNLFVPIDDTGAFHVERQIPPDGAFYAITPSAMIEFDVQNSPIYHITHRQLRLALEGIERESHNIIDTLTYIVIDNVAIPCTLYPFSKLDYGQIALLRSRLAFHLLQAHSAKINAANQVPIETLINSIEEYH